VGARAVARGAGCRRRGLGFPLAEALPPDYTRRVRARHLFRLTGDFVGYARVNRAWGIPALTLVLALTALLITVGQAAAPVTLYPLF
jgi:hypothetical protein